ncbi:hypothetical protein M5689_021569 [Euphorbia peplus]|nr:hypothetical protein M5689_021569 [Euphorbia peplus]
MKNEQFSVKEEEGILKKIKERLDVHHDDDYSYGEFVQDWKQFKEGLISNHDLYCKLVAVFYDDHHQDFLALLNSFFNHSLV